MEIKFGKEAREMTPRIGTIHIASGEKGAAVEGSTEEIIKSFIYICESMALVNVPEQMLIDIVKKSQTRMKNKPKVCPRCENVEIGSQDNFCKICGYQFRR